ncbi:hypothetical protein PATA110616_04875 [Paenibacillus tarimensis]
MLRRVPVYLQLLARTPLLLFGPQSPGVNTVQQGRLVLMQDKQILLERKGVFEDG